MKKFEIYGIIVIVFIGLFIIGFILFENSQAQETPTYQDSSNGLPTYGLWVSKTFFFDIDEDSTHDVMVLGPRKGSGDRSLHVFKWDGNSWSNKSSEEGTTTIPHSSYGGYDIGDLDNDGDWDVGVGSHGADRVDAYLRAMGNTWVRSSQGLQASEDAWNVDIGDFNSDGNLDLLVAGFWERYLHAYAGDGNGNWVDQSNGLGRASSSSEAFFSDINNDGNLDIVSSLGHDLDTDEVIWVYRGDGNGNWYNSSNGLPTSGNGNACTYGDFNNDGNVDIALSFWDSTVGTYFGDGTGNWTESSVGLVDLNYRALELIDLNNDKLDDLIAMEGSDPGQVHIYLRDSNGFWTKLNTDMRGNAKGYRLDVKDFDHNGYADIVAGFGSDNDIEYPGSVKVWKETHNPTELDVTLTYPDGNEYLKSRVVHFIQWQSAVPTTVSNRNVKLELSTTGENGPWNLIAENLQDTGIFQWIVPDEESGNCYIQLTLSDNLGNSVIDKSDNAFGIDMEAGGSSGEREPHDPITIQSDAEWTPTNGVRSGSGTEIDPYIIERWDIIAGDSNCISISNTRAYAIIRDNYLHHANGLNKGLVIAYAENLTVSENDITEVHHGINMGDSEVLIENNHLYSVHARGIMVSKENSKLTARGNLLENTGAWGFKLSSIGGMTDRGKWNYPALIENNTIIGATEGISLTAAQGNFTGNTIKNCHMGIIATLGTYSDAMNSTFAENTIINNEVGMDIGYKHETFGNGKSSVIIRGNLIERNVFAGLWLRVNASYYVQENTIALNTIGIETHGGGNQYIMDNTIKYNLGGIFFHYMREEDGQGCPLRRVIRNNDVFNNAYFALRNKAEQSPEIVKDNYYGGVPGDDGDLLEGSFGNDYRNSPNNPDTPLVRADVTVIDDGDEVTIDSITTLDTHYFIRKSGRLEISSNARVDLDGHRVAAKRGAELEVISADISNGLTLSLASDDAHIQDTTFQNMVAGVSVYMASPLIEEITVRDQNGSYMYHSHSSRPKYILEPSGIYLYRDTSRINGGNLFTEGNYGVFAFKSNANIMDLSITDKLWGMAVVDGHPRLEGSSIYSSEFAGVTTSDGHWPYGNVSLTMENCDLQNNPTGIEIQYGDIDSKGTPHNIRIANSTINGGTLALDAEIRDSIIEGNDITNNGVILDGKRVKLLGNTISGGSGLVLVGESLRLENNTFEDNQNGTVVMDCSPIFLNNDFSRNQYGVYSDTRGQPKLKFNNFESNVQYGVYNEDSSTLVNATLNWWNDASGPGGEGSGNGDSVSKYISYDPWLDVEGDHQGHYENLAPEVPMLELPTEALLAFDAKGEGNDQEGDIIRRVELRIENTTRGSGDYDSDWFSSNAIWRDVNVWGGYSHIFDALELQGEYTISARSFDGNDHSEIVSNEITVNHPELESHDPIVITGNSGFTPANGARSGSGTEGDPFIIERLEITTEDADGISISDTTAHVVIRLCHVYWPEARESDNYGIVLSNAVNVRVEDCRFQGNYYQMSMIQGSQAEVKDCLFLDSESGEIRSQQSDLEVTGSWFHGEKIALSMTGGNDEICLVEDNIIIFRGTNNGGIFLYIIDSLVYGNIFMNGTVTAGTTNEDIEFQIHKNTFSGGSAGIWFNDGSPEITRNLIVDHTGWGVYGDESTMTLRNNNLFGNKNWGVQNKDDSAMIDAKYNWWGAENGPSGEGSGDGDAVSEYVEFDLWFTEPYIVNNIPTIKITEPEDESVVNGIITIKGIAQDQDGNEEIVRIEVKVGNENWEITEGTTDWNYEIDTTEYEDEIYTISAKAYDGKDYSEIKSINLEFNNVVENIPPTVEITEPDNNTNVNGVIEIKGKADDENGMEDLEKVEVQIENENWELAGGKEDWNYEIDTTAYDDGKYKIYARAYDGVEYSTIIYIELEFDNEEPGNNKPTVEVTEPDDGSVVSDTITVKGTAQDQDGNEEIERVEIKIGNGNWKIAIGTSSWKYEIDTTNYNDGIYEIYVRAFDSMDYSDVVSIELEFDNEPEPGNNRPTVEISEPDDGSSVSGTIKILGNAKDDDGNDDIEKVEVKVGNDDWKIADGIENWEFEIDTTKYEDGSYTIYARTYDGKDYSKDVFIELEFNNEKENHKPTIEITEPEDGSIVKGTIVIKGYANDEDRNEEIEKVEVKIEGENWDVAVGKSSWNYEIITTNYDDGIYTISVIAYDGKEYSDTASIELEFKNYEQRINHKPTIEITEPKDESKVFGKITIKGNAEDKDGNIEIEKVATKIENGNWESADFSIISDKIVWSYEIDTIKYENEKYTIYARAYDGEDYSNIESIELKFANYENIAPKIVLFESDCTTYKIVDELMLYSEIEDENGNQDITNILIEIFILENGIPKKVETFGITDIVFSNVGKYKRIIEKSIILKNYEEGTYQVILSIEDNEGEQNTATFEFVIVESESTESNDEFNMFWIIPPFGIIFVVLFGIVVLRKRSSVEYENEVCPKCEEEMEYVKKYDDYYCYECEEYLEDM